MGFAAKVILDSIAPSGYRLTTMELTFPRFILAETNTHREMSKNTESSRAIPTKTKIRRVLEEPFVPSAWGKNRKGMSASELLEQQDADEAQKIWLRAMHQMVQAAAELDDLKVHKQYANRLIEPFSWVTQLISSTSWTNYFSLRCAPDAQPEFREIAELALDAYLSSEPVTFAEGAWHLPYIWPDEVELSIDELRKLSTARCARLSTLTQEGIRSLDADYLLFDRLLGPGHWSAFEHVAKALNWPYRSGNFIGWQQYRKTFPNEYRTELPRLTARVA